MAPKNTLSDLQSHLGYWMRMVSNAVSHSFARRLDAEGVTVAEWVFLRSLYDVSDIAPSQLAERMAMTRGGVSRLADRLVAKGLVARQADPTDKRAHKLALTPDGRKAVPKLAVLADKNDEQFFGALTPNQREQLEGLLRNIAKEHELNSAPTE